MRIASSVLAINSYGRYGVDNKHTVEGARRPGTAYYSGQTDYSAMGLFVPRKMRGANLGLSDADRSIQGKISAVQSDEEKFHKAKDALMRMRELAARSSDDTDQNVDRVELNLEYTQYKFELSSLGTLRFNGIDPAKAQEPVSFADQSDCATLAEEIIGALNAGGFGDIETVAAAKSAVSGVDNAISDVSAAQERLGEVRSRLESSLHGLGASAGSGKTAGSGSRSVGMAKDMINSIRKSLLAHSTSANLAQANITPQGAVQLI